MPKKISEDFDDEMNDYEPQRADGETIVKSLASIKYQTSRHLCINTGLSIGVILDWLKTFNLTGEVVSEQVGQLPAYFLPDNKPKGKLFLSGENSLNLRPFDEKPAHTSTRKIGDIVTADDLPKQDERDRRKRKFSPVAEIVHPQVDPAKLEELAAVNPKPAEIAAALGIKYSSLYSALQTSTAAYNAYHRGKNTFMKNQELQNKTEATASVSDLPPIKKDPRNTLRQKMTVEYLEAAGARGMSTAKIALELGVSSGSVEAILYHKTTGTELLAAWKRGKQKLLKLDHAKDIVSEMPKTVDDAETVEKFIAAREKTEILTPEKIAAPIIAEQAVAEDAHQGERTETAEVAPSDAETEPANKLTVSKFIDDLPRIAPITFFDSRERAKGELSVGFEGDFFALPEDKRIMLLQMAKIKDAFESDEA